MAARNWPDGIGHGQQREPKGERDSQKPNLVPREHRTATAAKDEHKCPYCFREIPFHRTFSSLCHCILCRISQRIRCVLLARTLRIWRPHRVSPGRHRRLSVEGVHPYLPPPSAPCTFLRVARFFWSPSTCCCSSTMDDPSSVT